MKRYALAAFLATLIFSSNAQICAELETMKRNFFDKTEAISAIEKPTAAQMSEYTKLYNQYIQKLDEYGHMDMPALAAMAIISSYTYVLLTQHMYQQSMTEIKFGYTHFLQYLERGDARCDQVYNGTYSYTQEQVRQIVSDFCDRGVYTAAMLNNYSFAQKLLMLTDERDMLTNTFGAFDASALVLDYKAAVNEIDDTCFTAAYGYMLAKYSPIPDGQARRLTIIDPLQVITNEKFINFRPARIKKYNYLDYHDYFTNLYCRISDSASDQELYPILKMFLKVYFAEKKNHGVDQNFMARLANGTNNVPAFVGKIKASGDTKFMRLMADFIDDAISKEHDYKDLANLYGGYLLYLQLGETKKAKKLFKRMGREPDPRFPKVD